MQETGAKSPDVTQLKIKLVLGEEALGRQRTYCRVPFGRSFSVSLIIDCRAVSGFETVSMILPWKSEVEHAELTALHPYSKTIQLQPKTVYQNGRPQNEKCGLPLQYTHQLDPSETLT